MSLNAGIFWDDWLLIGSLQHGNSAAVWHLAVDRGIPTDAVIWWAFASLPHIVLTYKSVVVVLLAISGLLVWKCASLCGFTRFESTAIACLAVAYPGCEAWVVLSIVQYLVYYVLFLAALWAALSAVNMTAARAVTIRIIAGILFFASFGFNSLLAWSAGVSLLLLVIDIRGDRADTFDLAWHSRLGRVVRSGYPFGLAVVYWVVKQIFFRPTGMYAGYNAIRIVSWSIIRSPVLFFLNGILRPIGRSIELVVIHPVLLATCVIVGFVVFRASSKRWQARKWILIVTAGIAGLALSVIPYAVVGLAPDPHGWSTRHNILLGIPLAVLLVGLARLASGKSRIGGRVATAAIAMLIVAFAFDSAAVNLGWLGRWAATESVAHNMPIAARAASVVWIDDRIDAPDEEPYRFYEWSSILERFDGVDGHLGVSSAERSPTFIASHARYFTSTYSLGHWVAGCGAAVKLVRGPSWTTTPANNGIAYLRSRLAHPERTNVFIANLVSVVETSMPSWDSVACGS